MLKNNTILGYHKNMKNKNDSSIFFKIELSFISFPQ